MGFEAKILADSISPHGIRLTTFEVTFPRIVLAEFNTHRQFSRNSASSRAIPIQKMLRRVLEEPYIPTKWGKNQKGMQAAEELSPSEAGVAEAMWLAGRDRAVETARALLEFGVHKQLTNRLLEPFLWHTVLVTATEWSNFFHLRTHPAAHPEIQIPAAMMYERYQNSQPKELGFGDWHTPLIVQEDDDWIEPLTVLGYEEQVPKVSCARCARVSFLTHDGRRDPKEDLELYDRLLAPGHMSPFEHAARPMFDEEYSSFGRWDCLIEDGRRMALRGSQHVKPQRVRGNQRVVDAVWGAFCGNFNGWIQHRKLIPREADILGEST